MSQEANVASRATLTLASEWRVRGSESRLTGQVRSCPLINAREGRCVLQSCVCVRLEALLGLELGSLASEKL